MECHGSAGITVLYCNDEREREGSTRYGFDERKAWMDGQRWLAGIIIASSSRDQTMTAAVQRAVPWLRSLPYFVLSFNCGVRAQTGSATENCTHCHLGGGGDAARQVLGAGWSGKCGKGKDGRTLGLCALARSHGRTGRRRSLLSSRSPSPIPSHPISLISESVRRQMPLTRRRLSFLHTSPSCIDTNICHPRTFPLLPQTRAPNLELRT